MPTNRDPFLAALVFGGCAAFAAVAAIGVSGRLGGGLAMLMLPPAMFFAAGLVAGGWLDRGFGVAVTAALGLMGSASFSVLAIVSTQAWSAGGALCGMGLSIGGGNNPIVLAMMCGSFAVAAGFSGAGLARAVIADAVRADSTPLPRS